MNPRYLRNLYRGAYLRVVKLRLYHGIPVPSRNPSTSIRAALLSSPRLKLTLTLRNRPHSSVAMTSPLSPRWMVVDCCMSSSLIPRVRPWALLVDTVYSSAIGPASGALDAMERRADSWPSLACSLLLLELNAEERKDSEGDGSPEGMTDVFIGSKEVKVRRIGSVQGNVCEGGRVIYGFKAA